MAPGARERADGAALVVVVSAPVAQRLGRQAHVVHGLGDAERRQPYFLGYRFGGQSKKDHSLQGMSTMYTSCSWEVPAGQLRETLEEVHLGGRPRAVQSQERGSQMAQSSTKKMGETLNIGFPTKIGAGGTRLHATPIFDRPLRTPLAPDFEPPPGDPLRVQARDGPEAVPNLTHAGSADRPPAPEFGLRLVGMRRTAIGRLTLGTCKAPVAGEFSWQLVGKMGSESDGRRRSPAATNIDAAGAARNWRAGPGRPGHGPSGS